MHARRRSDENRSWITVRNVQEFNLFSFMISRNFFTARSRARHIFTYPIFLRSTEHSRILDLFVINARVKPKMLPDIQTKPI